MHPNWPLALTICVKKDRERKGTLGKQARKGDTLRDHWETNGQGEKIIMAK